MMDIKLSEDQVQIARQARKFLEKESPSAFVRAMYGDPKGFTDELWQKMVEMGWMGMCLPEAYGGLNMDLLDLVIVLEEMGRAILPGPFFSSVILAGETLKIAGNDEQKERYLTGISTGEIKGTLALHEPDGGPDPGYIQMKVKTSGDGFIIDGIKLFVPDAHVADFIICATRTMEGIDPSKGITLFLLNTKEKGISIQHIPTMDGSRKFFEVRFQGVKVRNDNIVGRLDDGWESLGHVLRRAQVGISAECVGGAQRSMEIAVEYAKIRVQFDQPIGSFQAIKHRCAQMYVEVESARSLLYWAAWAQDHADPQEAAISASVAKAYCSEVFRNASASALQVLGGAGFSWEHDIHLYIKRAKGNEVAFGDPVYHREQIMRLLAK
jgi:alkylation response protein AidB-like acyl-CoA dehydrogenase